MSGSKSPIPRTYDYHKNLEKDIRFNLASPSKYKVPALLDENSMRIDKIGVKYNPHARFTEKNSPYKFFISEKHAKQSNYLRHSPPSTQYSPVQNRTFDQIAFHYYKHPNFTPTTFSTQERFHIPNHKD